MFEGWITIWIKEWFKNDTNLDPYIQQLVKKGFLQACVITNSTTSKSYINNVYFDLQNYSKISQETL